MKEIRGYDEIGRKFNEFFDEAKEDIIKLGVLDDYKGEYDGEPLKLWEDGKHKESIQLALEDERHRAWIKRCKDWKERRGDSAEFTRVQMVGEQLSTYDAWQLALFAEYQKQGAERVFTVDRKRLLGAAALTKVELTSDLLFFGKRHVLQWSYEKGSKGKVNGGTIYDVKAGDDISEFIALKEIALDLAKPIGVPLD